MKTKWDSKNKIIPIVKLHKCWLFKILFLLGQLWNRKGCFKETQHKGWFCIEVTVFYNQSMWCVCVSLLPLLPSTLSINTWKTYPYVRILKKEKKRSYSVLPGSESGMFYYGNGGILIIVWFFKKIFNHKHYK